MPIYNRVTADSTDLFGVVVDPSGAMSHRLDYRGRNRASSTPAGTIAVGAAAGNGATSATLGAGSTDDIGTISVVAAGTTASGVLCTLTFHDAWLVAPFVQLQARDAKGAGAIFYATTTTTQLVINVTNAPATGTILVDYDCTGGG